MSNSDQLLVQIELRSQRTRAMLDSRSTSNFINQELVKKNRLQTQAKQMLYLLTIADRNQL